jgi:hypothetical protein
VSQKHICHRQLRVESAARDSPVWGRDTLHMQYAFMCEILVDRKFSAHFDPIFHSHGAEGGQPLFYV